MWLISADGPVSDYGMVLRPLHHHEVLSWLSFLLEEFSLLDLLALCTSWALLVPPGSTGRAQAVLDCVTWWPMHQQSFRRGVQSASFILRLKTLGNSSAGVQRISLLRNQDADKQYPASGQMLPAPRNCWAPNSARTGDTDMTFRWERPPCRAWNMPHKWYLFGSWEPPPKQGRVSGALVVPGLEPALPHTLQTCKQPVPVPKSTSLKAAPPHAGPLPVPLCPHFCPRETGGWFGSMAIAQDQPVA